MKKPKLENGEVIKKYEFTIEVTRKAGMDGRNAEEARQRLVEEIAREGWEIMVGSQDFIDDGKEI